MFDVSFFELAVIGVLALVVLGPERLPGAARTLGGLLRRARASWAGLKSEIERELDAEALRKPFGDARREVEEPFDLLGKSLRQVSTRLDPSGLSRKSGLLSDAPATTSALAAMGAASPACDRDDATGMDDATDEMTAHADGVMLPLAAPATAEATVESHDAAVSLFADRSDTELANPTHESTPIPEPEPRPDGDDEQR